MKILTLLVTLALLLGAVSTVGLTAIEGKTGTIIGMSGGLECGLMGAMCKPGHEEKEPVVLFPAKDSSSLYYLHGIPREFLSKCFLKDVKVTGKIFEKARTILVENIQAKEGGKWVQVWKKPV